MLTASHHYLTHRHRRHRARWAFALVAFALLLVYPLTAPAGLSPALCSSTEERLKVPGDFVLDACFDGSTLVLVNRLDIPLEVSITGPGAGRIRRSPYGGAPEPASLALDGLFAPHVGFLAPRYQLHVPVGEGAVTVEVGGTEVGQAYALLNLMAEFTPAPLLVNVALSVPGLVGELRGAFDNRIACERRASNWIARSACKARFVWDTEFAIGRFAVQTGVEAVKSPPVVKGVIALVELTFITESAARDAVTYSRGSKRLTIAAAQLSRPRQERPAQETSWKGHIVQWDGDQKAQKTAWLVGADGRRRWIPSIAVFRCLKDRGVPGPTALPAAVLDRHPDLAGVHAECAAVVNPPEQPAATQPANPAARVTSARPTLVVSGTCTTAGGTLTGVSGGFTAGGTASISAWYPDGRPYPGIITTSRVLADGTIQWNWPCAGDAPGTYATEAVDDRSGISTGRVPFTVSAAPAAPPADQPLPAPAGVTLTVYNKVTNGPTEMREDTPAFLSSAPRNFCRRDGCVVPGTDRGSGGSLAPAVCQVTSVRTTNGHDGSAADDGNPGLFSSFLWYGVRLSDGTLGYISEVWITPAQRGGLGLPGC